MDNLIEAYKKGDLILFVGAGVSASLGLPTWNDLISEVARQLGYDADVFKTYGSNYALAEYYRLKKGSIGALRSWMDREWHKDIKIEKSEIHKLISTGTFSHIYTTNYDRWLEKSHDFYGVKYQTIRNVGDLVQIDSSLMQIVKFHGDFDDDDSIIFDETSYFTRLDFETPLHIKLRADILGKSVLFIGYSLSDINIRLLFFKLTKIWNSFSNKNVRPKSYIFFSRPNPIQEEILKQWGIQTFSSEMDDSAEAMVDFLKRVIS